MTQHPPFEGRPDRAETTDAGGDATDAPAPSPATPAATEDERPHRAADAMNASASAPASGSAEPDSVRPGPDEADPDAPAPDPWAWLDTEEAEPAIDTSGLQVTAVLVTSQAADWLAETLAALRELERRPDRLVVIDNASTDATADLLRDALEVGTIDRLVQGAAGDGFGAAVDRALAAETELDASGNDRAPDPSGRWLWLLHDDAVVAPDALAQLLRHVIQDPGIAVTGPKLLRPQLPRTARRARTTTPAAQLSEVGTSIAGTGRRDHGLEPGEVDQGQHDAPRDVLGVSTCGLLVRREVWDQLDGLTESLPVFRDGVDFGWRAWLAGHRVSTTPAATVVHRQVGHAGLRPDSVTGRHPARLDRALGLHVVLGHARGLRRPAVALRLVWGCLLRTVGYLIGKAPGRSVDELAALGSFLGHPGRTRAVRRRVKALSPTAPAVRAAERLRPAWWSSFAVGVNRAGSAWAERSTDRRAERDADLGTLDAMTGDDFAETSQRGPVWRSVTLGSFVVAVLLALLAARSLWHGGHLTGPGMLPAGPGGWMRWLAPIPASSATAPPWLGLVALLSSLVRPEPLATGLVCGMVPLAFLACQPLLHALTDNPRVRWWGALAWSTLPVLVGGENQARLALGVVAVTLPLLGLALRRLLSHRGLRGAWGTGLALAVATLVVPVLYAPALVAALVGAGALLARRDLRTIGRLGLALVVPVVLWAPWWWSLLRSGYPGRLLFGPAPALSGVGPAPTTWELVLGRTGGAGLPPLWVSAAAVGAVWLVALLALAVAPTRRAVLVGWGTALAAFGCAIAASRLVVAVPPLGAEARPWTGALVLLALGALVAAGAAGIPAITAAVTRRGFGALQPLTVLGAVLVVLAGLVGVGWFAWGGASGPVHRTTLTALPPYVLTAQRDAGVRTLAITMHGSQVHWSLVGGDQLRLGDSERGYAFGGATIAMNQTDDVTRRLIGGSGDEDIAPDLARLGIRYIWVQGADQAQQTVIGATPGLAVASGTETAQLWRVDRPTGPGLIISGDDTTAVTPDGELGAWSGSATIPAGNADRLLVLTAPADARWQASLDGVPLSTTSGSSVGATWQQVYRLGPDGGRLHWELPIAAHAIVLAIAQGVALLVLIVLALPALRPESRHPTTAARRAAVVTGSGRGDADGTVQDRHGQVPDGLAATRRDDS